MERPPCSPKQHSSGTISVSPRRFRLQQSSSSSSLESLCPQNSYDADSYCEDDWRDSENVSDTARFSESECDDEHALFREDADLVVYGTDEYAYFQKLDNIWSEVNRSTSDKKQVFPTSVTQLVRRVVDNHAPLVLNFQAECDRGKCTAQTDKIGYVSPSCVEYEFLLETQPLLPLSTDDDDECFSKCVMAPATQKLIADDIRYGLKRLVKRYEESEVGRRSASRREYRGQAAISEKGWTVSWSLSPVQPPDSFAKKVTHLLAGAVMHPIGTLAWGRTKEERPDRFFQRDVVVTYPRRPRIVCSWTDEAGKRKTAVHIETRRLMWEEEEGESDEAAPFKRWDMATVSLSGRQEVASGTELFEIRYRITLYPVHFKTDDPATPHCNCPGCPLVSRRLSALPYKAVRNARSTALEMHELVNACRDRLVSKTAELADADFVETEEEEEEEEEEKGIRPSDAAGEPAVSAAIHREIVAYCDRCGYKDFSPVSVRCVMFGKGMYGTNHLFDGKVQIRIHRLT